MTENINIEEISTLNYTNTTSYAAGGTISGTSLTLAAADASNPGLISTGAQTIVGAKTFSSTTTFNEDIKVNDITIGVGRRDNSSITSTAVGKSALGLNTTGSGNTALGQLSMSFNTTGGFNSAAGALSLGSNTTGNFKRRIKEVITYISVDSRDRNKSLYSKASYFKIFLGKTFYNVKSIKLSSMEFPNTNAVINTTNHAIYWTNQEDITLNKINAITQTYPEYYVQLRTGSYISSSLQTEITNKLSSVKRKDKTGDYHYFIVTLDIDTDVVTFISLILKQLSNNSLQTSENTSIIQVTLTDHGYNDGEIIYLQGAKTIAGIPSTTLNTAHKITKINNNIFQFEVNIKAAETLQGGGNTIKTGRIAPFKFLFGEKSTTIAPNIGFPLENSSDLIKTYIKSITNLYQATIVTQTPHNLSNSFLGSICSISSSGTIPSVNGNKRITQILSTTSFTILIDGVLLIESYNTGQITISSKTYDVLSISNSVSNTILVSTFGKHNYTTSDIGSTVALYDTTTVPVLDDSYTIFNIFEETSFVIPGTLPDGGSSPPGGTIRDAGLDGYIPRNKPITTHTVLITGVSIGLSTTTFTCPNHELKVGDIIRFENFKSTPNISLNNQIVFATPNNDTIVLNVTLNSYVNADIELGKSFIKTGLTTVSFPYHGFNKVVSIQNTDGFPTGQTYGNLILVQTQLPHNYSNSEMVRLANTNTTPSIDGGYNITVKTSDTFTIPYSFPITSSGNSGITSFNQDFYLYGVKQPQNRYEVNVDGNNIIVTFVADITRLPNEVFANDFEIKGKIVEIE